MQTPEPQQEHQWLQRLVGEWTYEGECGMGPDQSPMKSTGKESVRSFGGLWTIGDGLSEMPAGGERTAASAVPLTEPQFLGTTTH